MKLFRSDQRKDHRHELTDEERAWLEARERTSPGKVSATLRMVYAPRGVAPEEGDEAWAGLSARAADSITQRRWAGAEVDKDALFGMTRSDDREGPMLGTGREAMRYLALPGHSARTRPAHVATGGGASAPVQGKGLDERPEPGDLRIETTASGEKLPEDVRARMEATLGMDFSGVRIHVGDQAPSVGAVAFTRGTDIFFAPGRYQPGSREGQELIGHELTHVKQQAEGRVGATTDVGGVGINDDVGLEREADEMGAKAARGEATSGQAGVPGVGFQAETRAPARRAASANARTTASAGHESTTAVVQRRSLEQAGLTDGLVENGTSGVVGLAFQVKKYKVTVPQEEAVAGRVEALQKAAELNAELGVKLNAQGPNGKCVFTKKPGQFGNESNKDTIDPFVLEIEVPFSKDGGIQTLIVEYQHARAFTGYVSKITDSSNAAATGGAKMYAAAKGAPPSQPDEKYPVDHDETDNSNIAGMTEGNDHKALDAYTKLAGEGARWLCVRNHTSRIQNDTVFFTVQAEDPTKVWGITFSVLWKTWDLAFDKGYNITDSRVAQELSGGRLVDLRQALDLAAMTDKDYNLDTGAAHTPAT